MFVKLMIDCGSRWLSILQNAALFFEAISISNLNSRIHLQIWESFSKFWEKFTWPRRPEINFVVSRTFFVTKESGKLIESGNNSLFNCCILLVKVTEALNFCFDSPPSHRMSTNFAGSLNKQIFYRSKFDNINGKLGLLYRHFDILYHFDIKFIRLYPKFDLIYRQSDIHSPSH